mmetsp:Transcript_20938/g.38932  ORF Transcript_20938/g.38932 Transcript_20938/m.38932 type:complete len:637 (+) Transcript_20938:108-2018(+)
MWRALPSSRCAGRKARPVALRGRLLQHDARRSSPSPAASVNHSRRLAALATTGAMALALGVSWSNGWSTATTTPTDMIDQPARRRKSAAAKKLALLGNSHYTYIVIGSGTAAYTALESIRQGSKRDERILLISDEHHMARLDVVDGQEELDERLQDVYNEWRRHIACRLASDDQTRVIGPSGASTNVRKWGTRREPQDKATQPTESEEQLNTVSVLVESITGITINPGERKIVLSDGSQISYDRCLLAPPGHPRELYVLPASISITLKDKINSLKDAQDFQDLQRIMHKGNQKIVVVGGGFLGTTLSAALVEMNKLTGGSNTIVQTFVESRPLQQYFPKYLGDHLVDVLSRSGLQVIPDRLATAISRAPDDKEESDTRIPVTILPMEDDSLGVSQNASDEDEDEDDEENESSGRRSQSGGKAVVTVMQGNLKENLDDCDLVVLASTNVSPDVEIAVNSQLETDAINGGVVCNSSLEAYNGLFVAGTSASFFDPILGRRRVDFYDNALNMGLLAGQNMTSEDGRLLQYKYQPTFRCILPGTGLYFEAVGQLDSDDKTVGLWLSKRDAQTGKPLEETAFERGVVFYIRDNIVVGILTCNATECLEAARDIVSERLSYEKASKRILLAPKQWVRVFHTK